MTASLQWIGRGTCVGILFLTTARYLPTKHHQALLPRYAALLPVEATAAVSAAAAAAATSSASPPSSSSAPAGPAPGGLKSRYKRPPPSTASAAADAASPDSAGGAGASSAGGPAGGLPLAPLLRALVLGPGAAVLTAGGGCSGMLPLTGPQRLSAAFRAYKQMVLWDAVLGCGLSGEELAALL